MHETRGGANPLNVLMTTEVRWFYPGPLPAVALEWFTRSGSVGTHEFRVDIYDVTAAERGVGVKIRAGGFTDSKSRISRRTGVAFGNGLVGQLEEWAKTSYDIDQAEPVPEENRLAIRKSITTRRFLVNVGDGPGDEQAGCEAEVASLEVDGIESWTFCFEAFGPPQHREDALRQSMHTLFGEGPVPHELDLNAGLSCGYPGWIVDKALKVGLSA